MPEYMQAPMASRSVQGPMTPSRRYISAPAEPGVYIGRVKLPSSVEHVARGAKVNQHRPGCPSVTNILAGLMSRCSVRSLRRTMRASRAGLPRTASGSSTTRNTSAAPGLAPAIAEVLQRERLQVVQPSPRRPRCRSPGRSPTPEPRCGRRSAPAHGPPRRNFQAKPVDIEHVGRTPARLALAGSPAGQRGRQVLLDRRLPDPGRGRVPGTPRQNPRPPATRDAGPGAESMHQGVRGRADPGPSVRGHAGLRPAEPGYSQASSTHQRSEMPVYSMTGYASVQSGDAPGTPDTDPKAPPSSRIGLEIRRRRQPLPGPEFRAARRASPLEPACASCWSVASNAATLRCALARRSGCAKLVPHPAPRLCSGSTPAGRRKSWLPQASALSVSDVIRLAGWRTGRAQPGSGRSR
jgi:hypothetical protein